MKKEGIRVSHNKTLLWIIILLFVLLLIVIGLIIRNAIRNNNSNTNIGIVSCKTDTDCVKVQISCCACNSGGEEKCVLKSEISSYQDKLAKCNPKILCAQYYNCKIKSCGCVKGECIGNEV